MRHNIETLQTQLTAQDWQALAAYRPYSPSTPPVTQASSSPSGFSPATFLQSSQFNTCWLTAQNESPVFVLYDQKNPIGNGIYASVFEAITPHPEYVNLNLVLRYSNRKPPQCNLYNFEGVFAHNITTPDQPSYACLLPKGQMNLAEYIQMKNGGESRCLPPADEADIFSTCIKTTRALLHLHNQNISHHDVKPPNFMYMPDGEIILMDPDMAETKIDGFLKTLKGTPCYMNIQKNVITKAIADQFALRRTLYLPEEFSIAYRNNNAWFLGVGKRNRLHETSTVRWIIPDEFFENRPYLKQILSAKFFKEDIYPTVAEILCVLILARHDLFEDFANKHWILPPELTALILAYYDREPNCELLDQDLVRQAIQAMAFNPFNQKVIRTEMAFLRIQLSLPETAPKVPETQHPDPSAEAACITPTPIFVPSMANAIPGQRLFSRARGYEQPSDRTQPAPTHNARNAARMSGN